MTKHVAADAGGADRMSRRASVVVRRRKRMDRCVEHSRERTALSAPVER
jgi:hypothetical protein